MTVLRFRIDQNLITNVLTGEDIETIERFQEGEQIGTYRIKKMAAKFMVDENGKEIQYQQAIKTFNAMLAPDYNDALVAFITAMQDAALPKASGTPLNSPSNQDSQKPVESPDGL